MHEPERETLQKLVRTIDSMPDLTLNENGYALKPHGPLEDVVREIRMVNLAVSFSGDELRALRHRGGAGRCPEIRDCGLTTAYWRPSVVVRVALAADANDALGRMESTNECPTPHSFEIALLLSFRNTYSGIASVESMEILKVDLLRAFGTPVEIVKLFGGRDNYLAAIRELETALYERAA
jgi:hypothetical protein